MSIYQLDIYRVSEVEPINPGYGHEDPGGGVENEATGVGESPVPPTGQGKKHKHRRGRETENNIF